jgi:hypothetical protein
MHHRMLAFRKNVRNMKIVRRQNGRTATSFLSQAYGLLF